MPRIRLTVPFGSSRAVTDGSRRNDRMAAMEVMGLLMVRPPLARPTLPGRALFLRSVSATSDEIGDPAHLRDPFGLVLLLVVVVHGGADQRRGRPAGAGRRREQRGDQIGDGAVEVTERDDEVGDPHGAGLARADGPAG